MTEQLLHVSRLTTIGEQMQQQKEMISGNEWNQESLLT